MEVRIGVTHASREISLETAGSVDDLQRTISDALTNDDNLLVLSDQKGRTLLVPTDKLAYVEIVGETGRRVGFGTI
ncbi:MAG: DUF3107 domain-containing protein [Propionibacteriales bacterium]|nr:DUF3107 domain-containing protein [Propionibacteriales bacterium]